MKEEGPILTLIEKVVFLSASFLTVILAVLATQRLVRIIARGYGQPDWEAVPKRLFATLLKTLTFSPVFQTRLLISIFHGLVGWGFTYYLLVNIGDVLQGFIPDYLFLGEGLIGNLYRLGADLLSGSVLVGMVALLFRRFLLRPNELEVRETTLLDPKARSGITRDSIVVGGFILLHVGARFIGESFHLARIGLDDWQPLASMLSGLWSGWLIGSSLEIARHVAWWTALGLILAFIPYFPYSKHLHLFFAPLNHLLHPERRSMGELDPLDFEDESVEQFGVSRMEELSWKGILDAYACIMCNRCQDACPAYSTGKVLSPAALEINKRYLLNQEGEALAKGEASRVTLIDAVIPAEAIWACTACGACIDICPVANEPMRDILEVRRHLVLMENAFPDELQMAFRGMERTANPWNVPSELRMEWAEGLDVPTVGDLEKVDLLWWVGCAPATDPRAQETARAFTRVLKTAGVSFAVLGSEERCTGDSARRSGNEYLFNELANINVNTLNRVAPKRIVTTCPHCLHTLRNEYPAFGGHYEVIHHTQLLAELLGDERFSLMDAEISGRLTFHDPCYLGRQNGLFDESRETLDMLGINLTELPRSRARSFCCGAGGAQMWKEEEEGEKRVSNERIQEAQRLGAKTLAVGCPFCMIMLNDAATSEGGRVEVRDVVELVVERIREQS